jgi:secreted trypsin-like serine protease
MPVPPGTTMQASGWGLTGATADTSNLRDRMGWLQRSVSWLRVGNLQAMPPAACEANANFRKLAAGTFRMRPGQLCAGSDEGRDTCKGDSGGPLVWNRGSVPYLVGLVSFGPGCGQSGTPGVYTDVRHYAGWIARAKRASTPGRIRKVR